MDVSYGFLSVLPLILMIVLAVITKKVLEPVILCTLLAFIISDKTNFFFAWASALESEVSNFAYFTLVFASIGALIRLLMKSNSVIGFSRLLSKFIKSRRSALMATWLAGILVFADDFINSLGVGTSMRTLTDKYHVSREFLAYTINSTGAIVCILVPMSTWGAFLSLKSTRSLALLFPTICTPSPICSTAGPRCCLSRCSFSVSFRCLER